MQSSLPVIIEVFEVPAWLKMVEEPDEWYEKFVKYYLPLGPSRTLLRAFTKFVEDVYPKDTAAELISRRSSAPNSWSDMARTWDWRERGKEYDRKTYAEANNKVSAARLRIQELSLDAVEALANALKNPKTAVAAAERILDRSGLPAKSVHIHELVPFTSDDYAAAAKELDEWTKSLTQNSNG